MWDFALKNRKTNIAFQGGRTKPGLGLSDLRSPVPSCFWCRAKVHFPAFLVEIFWIPFPTSG
jgi:hypothetical protein